jgi:hypothetical protein
MDWIKKYRFKTLSEKDNWNIHFPFQGRRLDDPYFSIECDMTEEEYFSDDN